MKVNVLREVCQPWHSRTSQTKREFLSIVHLVIYLNLGIYLKLILKIIIFKVTI